MPVIQTKVVLGEKSKVFFQEVEFDFTKICPKGIFMIENKTEKVKVVPYIVGESTIVFNAWITKNIAYKVAENVYDDKKGITTVTGPIRHMTKVIKFGGAIDLDLPKGVVLTRSDKAEVLSASVIGSNDELLCPVELKPSCFMEKQEKEEKREKREKEEKEVKALRRPSIYDYNNRKMGYYSANMEKEKKEDKEDKEDKDFDCPRNFDVELYQYGKLREKMAIEIVVKAVRVSHINVEENDIKDPDC